MEADLVSTNRLERGYSFARKASRTRSVGGGGRGEEGGRERGGGREGEREGGRKREIEGGRERVEGGAGRVCLTPD